MTEVQAFRAFHYDTTRIDLSRVIVPPYDVIAPDERALYYDRDPHSAIRLELTRDVASEAKTDYAEVARTLADWRREGVLVQDPVPALYGLRQRFQDARGRDPRAGRLLRSPSPRGVRDGESFVPTNGRSLGRRRIA